jgi:O-antigen/teichoic acid export membrane protein
VPDTPVTLTPDLSPQEDGQLPTHSPGSAPPLRESVTGPGKRYGKLAKRGVAWAFLRSGITEAITTPTSMILARLLTPFDFGVGAAAGFFLAMAARLTNVGFNQALVRLRHLRDDHCSSVFVVSLALGMLMFLSLALSAELLAHFLKTPQLTKVMPIAALSFVIRAFGTVPSALLVRNMEYRRNAVPDWLSSAGEAIAAITCAWLGYGYWSIIYGSLVGDVLNSGLKLALGGWIPSFRFSWPAMSELFSFGTGVFVKRLLDYGANNLDNLVVGRSLGMTALGFYDKAFSTMNKALVRVNTGGPVVSFRIFSIISDEPERFRKAYRKVALASAVLTYPVFAGIAMAAPDLVVVLYGERWTPAVLPFQILCIAAGFRVPNEYAGSAAQALGGIWSQVWRQAVSVALLVVFVVVLSSWGIGGAALGVLLSTVAMAVLMHALLIRMTGLHVSDIVQPLVPAIALSFIIAIAVLAARHGMLALGVHSPFVRLLAECGTSTLCLLGCLKLNAFDEVRRLVHDIAADLPPVVGRVVRMIA